MRSPGFGLILSGTVATAVIAVAGSWASPTRGPAVGWPELLALLEATFAAGLGLGRLAFGRRT